MSSSLSHKNLLLICSISLVILFTNIHFRHVEAAKKLRQQLGSIVDKKFADDLIEYLKVIPVSRSAYSDIEKILGKDNKFKKEFQRVGGIDQRFGVFPAILSRVWKRIKKRRCENFHGIDCKCQRKNCVCPPPTCECPPCPIPLGCPKPGPGEQCPPIKPCICPPSATWNVTTEKPIVSGQPNSTSTISPNLTGGIVVITGKPSVTESPIGSPKPSTSSKPETTVAPTTPKPTASSTTQKQTTTNAPTTSEPTTSTTTDAPTTTSKPDTSEKPATSEPPTSEKPDAEIVQPIIGAPGRMNYKIVREYSSKKSHTSNSQSSMSITLRSSKDLSNFGELLLDKYLNEIFANDSIHDAIENVLSQIPKTIGGVEMRKANKILAQFNEPRVPPFKSKRARSRSYSFYTARDNARSTFGHILDLIIKNHCKCDSCDFCLCPAEAVCHPEEEKKQCPTCPKLEVCPAPPGCEDPKPCGCPREDEDDFIWAADRATGKVIRRVRKPAATNVAVRSHDLLALSELAEPIACSGTYCTSDKICGKAPINRLTPSASQSPYMTNGEAQVYGEWPFYVRLTMTNPTVAGMTSLCGGVLISDRHVLTAGHCIVAAGAGTSSKTFFPAQNFLVTLGEHTRSKHDAHEVNSGVSSVCRTRRYSDSSGETTYDYAILTLQKPIKLGDYIQPACLPFQPLNVATSKCFVVGMGVVGHKNGQPIYNDIVQKMQVSQKSCNVWRFHDRDRSRHCFSRANGDGDTCGGDSGGPIVCLDKHRRWTVVGLVSYGSPMCDGTTNVGWIGVYTRVNALLKYITADCPI